MSLTRPDAPSMPEATSSDGLGELVRPIHVATERLRTTIEQLGAERARAVADLRRAVLHVGHECASERRPEVARLLYWRYTEIPVGDITVALGFRNQAELLAAAGPVTSRASCIDCSTPLLAANRRRLTELNKLAAEGPTPYGLKPLCRWCEAERDRAVYEAPPDEIYEDEAGPWDQKPS
jgi:hypothetical protein